MRGSCTGYVQSIIVKWGYDVGLTLIIKLLIMKKAIFFFTLFLSGFAVSLAQVGPPSDSPMLTFQYDSAGNQTQREYCEDFSKCGSKSARTAMINDEVVEELSVYPNPTNGRLLIQMDAKLASQAGSVQVYSVISALILNLSFDNANRVEIDLSGKPSGIYFVRIHLNNGKQITKKVIKL